MAVTQRLHDYMVVRAKQEGLSHELPVDFYEGLFELGTRTFFGITIDDQGHLIEDKQNPKVFQQWTTSLLTKKGCSCVSG